jgi:tRNA pseudouridine55 synthase
LTQLRRTRSGHFTLMEGRHTTFDALKQGRREEVIASMMSLYDVSRLRGA